MAGLKKKRRVQLILAGFVVMAAAFTAICLGFSDSIEFFRSPTQVTEAPDISEREVFRLGGLVADGSWTREGTSHSFIVTDTANDVPVIYAGIVPDLFREGQGMIATGRLVDGVFQATNLLAKHDESYMPKEVADALKARGVFQPSAD